MSFALRSRREVAVLAGLIIAGILPFAKAKALPPKVRTNRTTYGAVRAELSDLSPVSRIRSWNGDMYARVVIDVGSEVKYRSARIPEPDRIYVDIEDAKLTSEMVHTPIDVGNGDLLKGVRVAQNRGGILRVVLDVNQVKNYSVSLLPDPYRLVVDLYGASAAVKEDAPNRVTPPPEPAAKYLPAVKTEKTAMGTLAAAPPKSTEGSTVKSALLASANTSSGESRSLPALLPSNAASSPGGKQSPRRETEINAAKGSEKYDAAAKPSTAQAGEIGASAPSSNLSPVSSIRTSNGDMHTRVVIDVGSEVKYRSTRISEPDRIYFDIEGAKLTSAMVHKSNDVGDDVLLKGVRVAQNRDGISRVVLDVNQVKDYSVSLLPDPYRLVVDLYGASAAVKADATNRVPAPAQPAAKDVPSVKTEKTAKGAVAAAPAKSTEGSAVKSAVVPPANNSAVKSQSLPALPYTPPSSGMGKESQPRETASNPAKDSEKYLAAASQSNTAQDGEVTASTPPPAAAEKKATPPPKVTYQDGQLTIIAENALLSDILSALHTLMGAEIDLPASASSDRIWVRLGPGPARKVVSELLSGTDLNFVIQGSMTDADGIQSVMLTPHSEGGPGNPGISGRAQERMANRQLAGGNPALVEAAQQENPSATETTTASSDPIPPTPPDAGSPRAGPQPGGGSLISAVEESVAHPSPPSSLNSEEIRQQLLSMYQQRRQLQQNQPSTPANPHP
jgi:AMIN domain